jgi:hypothetical protein
MKFETFLTIALIFSASAMALGAGMDPSTATVKGYVLDSACEFTKNLAKPIGKECAVSCAKSGSPLVILADSGVVYWPIADTMPAVGQNDKLLPFAAQRVTATGKVFTRGGSHAIVIDKIELAPSAK